MKEGKPSGARRVRVAF